MFITTKKGRIAIESVSEKSHLVMGLQNQWRKSGDAQDLAMEKHNSIATDIRIMVTEKDAHLNDGLHVHHHKKLLMEISLLMAMDNTTVTDLHFLKKNVLVAMNFPLPCCSYTLLFFNKVLFLLTIL